MFYHFWQYYDSTMIVYFLCSKNAISVIRLHLPFVCFLNTGIRPMNGNFFTCAPLPPDAPDAEPPPFFSTIATFLSLSLRRSAALSPSRFFPAAESLSLSVSGTRGLNSGYLTIGFSTRDTRVRDRERVRRVLRTLLPA